MSDPVIPDVQTPLAKPGAKAREISKWGMVLGMLWIGVLTLVKGAWSIWAKKPFGLEMTDIIYSGLAMVALFSPVYISIFLDKLTGNIKPGAKS